MKIPKKTKYNKMFKGKGYFLFPISSKAKSIHFGSYGLISLECGRITAQQIEASRKAIVHELKRMGQLWIRLFPDIPVTAKPIEVRQGKGKGSVEFWTCRVKEQRVLFELDGVPMVLAKKALKLGAAKLSIKTKFISKSNNIEE